MLKIEKLINKERVYDVTVEGSGNFYANGILLHNCSEIILPTDKGRTAVCCLSSVNLEHFDDWKNDKLFLHDVAEMLDNVLQYFIDNAPNTIKRAKYSAMRERSIGIGALGWHAYLQKNMIPWESALATSANHRIFKHIKKQLDKANFNLALKRGEAPDNHSIIKVFTIEGEILEFSSSEFVAVNDMGIIESVPAFDLSVGDIIIVNDVISELNFVEKYTITKIEKEKWVGRRFSHMMAIAPNASSSILMNNTSPSIEPYRANCYRQDTLSGAFLNKNRFLDELIREESKNHKEDWYDETWSSIISNDGSIQHLIWLSDEQKDVFKTAMEIDQRWVVQHASDRQEYIDQAQSVNLFFRPDANLKYLHAAHFMAWKNGLKTLYYCRSDKIGKADKVAKKIERQVIDEIDLKAMAQSEEICLACEG